MANTAKPTDAISAIRQVTLRIWPAILFLGGCADSTPSPLETDRPQVLQSASAARCPDRAWGPHKSNWSTTETGMKADEWTERKRFSTLPDDAAPLDGCNHRPKTPWRPVEQIDSAPSEHRP